MQLRPYDGKSEQTTLALGLNSFAELTKYSYSKIFHPERF